MSSSYFTTEIEQACWKVMPEAETPALVLAQNIGDFWEFFINLPECKLIKASGSAIYKDKKYIYLFTPIEIHRFDADYMLVLKSAFLRADKEDFFREAKARGISIVYDIPS